MKYLIYSEMKELSKKTWEKVLEVEKGRQERGETFNQTGEMIGQYMTLDGKGFTIIETDVVSSIIKWTTAYGSFGKIKVVPVLNRKEMNEAMK